MSQVTFKRPDGTEECPGYYVEPAAGKNAPALVVIQEWWGVNDHIKSVADRYAKDGFRVLVPDLYRGKVGLDAKEAEHLMTGLNFGDAAGQDIRGAVQYLKQSSAKVGVSGYCMGGALTILAAVFVPEVDAAVAWYGFPPLEYVDASKIKAPLMGHFAIHDGFFKIEQVDQLEAKLKAAGVKYTFYRYDAGHAFASDDPIIHTVGLKKDATAAVQAWDRTLEFFHQQLGAPQHA
jgi:carboxymethylenebutenolidase